jgi:6-phosphogluconolactonase
MSNLSFFPDINQLYNALAQKIISELRIALEAGQKPLNLAISGGRTPQGLFACMQDKFIDSKILSQLNVYWVDERHVPFEDSESNYGNSRPFIEALGIPLNQIHPMGANSNIHKATLIYNELIEDIDKQRPEGNPLFDLTLLGLGPDGHVASLFPGKEHQYDTTFCKAARHPQSGQPRISLTLQALNRSKCCIFLASGNSKANIVSEVVKGGPNPKYPASLVNPHFPPLWFIDEAAAKLL